MPKRKEPIEAGVGVLELKLGACLTGPTKRMVADLFAVAHACNRARTAMVRWWERWREDHPEWQPEQVIARNGTPKLWNGQPLLRNMPLPEKVPVEDGEVSGSTALYRAGRLVCPEVGSNLIASAAQEVWKDLQANVPYNHVGIAHYRWQAVLNYEDHRACYKRGLVIPAPNKEAVFCYEGKMSRELSSGVAEEIRRLGGNDSAVVRFPLFSRDAGRRITHVICRVEVRQRIHDGRGTAGRGTRQRGPGYQQVLRNIASGTWKLSDSKVVYKEGERKGEGAWYFQVTYQQPRLNYNLDKQRTALLACGPADGTHPFFVTTEGCPRPWSLGWVRPLLEEWKRLDTRRRALRADFRTAEGGARGHGKGRYFRDLHRPTRQARGLMERFTDALVAEILKFCVRYNCGRLLYGEPSVFARKFSWFAKRDVPYDWTSLEAKLRQKCWLYNVEFVKERPKGGVKKASG